MAVSLLRRVSLSTGDSAVDDEHLTRVEVRGQKLRRVLCDQEDVLAVPVSQVGFERDDHSGLEGLAAASAKDRLLLVPPRADAVADKPGFIPPPGLRELLDDEVIELADGNTGAQTVGGGQ